LRKLEDAKYIHTEKSGNGAASRTEVVLTPKGRQALNVYKAALRDLIDGL
jgi:DNA-binding MarR family transcriptional regulator